MDNGTLTVTKVGANHSTRVIKQNLYAPKICTYSSNTLIDRFSNKSSRFFSLLSSSSLSLLFSPETSAFLHDLDLSDLRSSRSIAGQFLADRLGMFLDKQDVSRGLCSFPGSLLNCVLYRTRNLNFDQTASASPTALAFHIDRSTVPLHQELAV